MQQKIILRKKFFNLRKNKYYEINKEFFLPLLKLVGSKFKKKTLKIALYYPSNFELNVLKLLEINSFTNYDTLLPVIDKTNLMNFFSWKKNDILFVNNFGILEPLKSKIKVPLIIDAGIGDAVDAAEAMQLGCDGVLINTAIAKAKKPFLMAEAMKLAIQAGRKSYLSGRIEKNIFGNPSSPKSGII